MQNDLFHPSGELSLIDGVVQLSFLIQGILGRVGAEYDLSIIQVRLLGIVRDREPGMQQLAQHLKLDKSSITGLVDRAERRGLVERIPSPNDRRAISVRITAEGRRLVETAGAEIEQQVEAALKHLNEAERSQLTRLAGKVLFDAGD
ncbi:MarR family winged helix-turn-helix transcriptional regulator [Paenibacillus sp. NFR01]|uniref:MarR family winged helix-turn-helix transcriptional regulator n=1 Tax=Paenibacillus sp. NFR01 TaxID=1566279 RepID=UPI0008C270C8|nr:MarR family transcriptional regulator [Paenibacillus sp. NFR01]SEU10481.1 DNA-binding transcriptional regulator, MarR family [Paenibacillus sp. NFR01]